jgi:hypothetical protein
MMTKLAKLPDVTSCFARQVFRYTASGQEGPEDEESVQLIAKALEASEGRIARAFTEAVKTKIFLNRRGE